MSINTAALSHTLHCHCRPLSYATLSLPPSLIRYTVTAALSHTLHCLCVCLSAVAREDTLQKVREVVRPFDWTYTTDYSGTLLPAEQAQLQVLA